MNLTVFSSFKKKTNSKWDTLMEEDALKQLPSIISAIFCSKLAHHEKNNPKDATWTGKKTKPTH